MLKPSHLLLCISLALCSLHCGDDDRPTDTDPPPDTPVDNTPDTPATATSFTVVTWNVENLFDTVRDRYTFGLQDTDDVLAAGELAQKLNGIANVLRPLNADVIAFQEVEKEGLLVRLAEDYLGDMGYTVQRVIDAEDPRGIDVGVLSKLPVTMFGSHVGEFFEGPGGRYTFARDALEVFVAPGGNELAIMILHLRSKNRDDPDKRLAEALQARAIIDRRLDMGLPHALIVGDFNDTPGSPPLDAILGDGRFHDFTTSVPMADRWTVDFGGEQQVDYVVGTQSLKDFEVNTTIVHSLEAEMISDHAPVRTELFIQP